MNRLALALAAAVLLAGCGAAPDAPPPDTPTPEVITKTVVVTKTVTVTPAQTPGSTPQTTAPTPTETPTPTPTPTPTATPTPTPTPEPTMRELVSVSDVTAAYYPGESSGDTYVYKVRGDVDNANDHNVSVTLSARVDSDKSGVQLGEQTVEIAAESDRDVEWRFGMGKRLTGLHGNITVEAVAAA